MAFIENLSDFKSYMEANGPPALGSRRNYISWLRLISNNGFEINSNLTDNETILNFLKANEDKRKVYKSKSLYHDIKSALNKYRSFLDSNYTSIVTDIKQIETQEIPATEKDELIKARIGQGKYRKELIGLWNMCSVSQLPKNDFLIASHILPWRNSSNQQRLDMFNGLLLLPNYDKLFDHGYISFKNDGSIILSPDLKMEEYKKLGISIGDKLFKVFEENKFYLEKHREIYKNQLNLE